jgi:hypothetical protein
MLFPGNSGNCSEFLCHVPVKKGETRNEEVISLHLQEMLWVDRNSDRFSRSFLL